MMGGQLSAQGWHPAWDLSRLDGEARAFSFTPFTPPPLCPRHTPACLTHADPTCLVSTVKHVTLNGTSFPYDVIYPSAGAAVLRVTKMNLKQGPESEGVSGGEGEGGKVLCVRGGGGGTRGSSSI